MVDTHSSPTEKRLSEEADRIEDMAALLFAELFYKQVMAERAQKQADAKKYETPPPGSDGSRGIRGIQQPGG